MSNYRELLFIRFRYYIQWLFNGPVLITGTCLNKNFRKEILYSETTFFDAFDVAFLHKAITNFRDKILLH